MLKTLFQRITLIIPFILFVMYSLFMLTQYFPIDAVVQSLENQGVDIHSEANLFQSKLYKNERSRLGLDKPLFYFKIRSSKLSSALPSIKWTGIDNQFHQWISRLIVFDFGKATTDGRDAGHKTKVALGYTLTYMIPSLFFTYLLALSFGIFIGQYPDHWLRQFLSAQLYLIAAIPLFWIATLCVIYLTTPLYGKWLDLFPTVDVIVGSRIPFSYYLLPILIMTFHSLAYLTIQVKNLYIDQAQSPYVVGLKARGINPTQIKRKHILLNLMVPITTLFTKSIPTTIGGSVVLEQIFNIPGIGRLLLSSIQTSDWIVTVPIILVIAVVTLMSYLLADVLYTYFDPRIKSPLLQ